MLKCLTLTGADDSVQPGELFDLSKEFPFVEWGILLSKKNMGNPRYPSADWLHVLGEDYNLLSKQKAPAKLSLHVCGQYVRKFIMGEDDFINDLGLDFFNIFKRVQINTHGENLEWDLPVVVELIQAFPSHEFIFQLDGNGVNEGNGKMLSLNHALKNVSYLNDLSSGAGVLPSYWPIPQISSISTGYAGGLGADNLTAQFELIKKAVDQRTDFTGDWWLDMETKLRSWNTPDPGRQDKDIFNLEKCKEVLTIAQPWFNNGEQIPV